MYFIVAAYRAVLCIFRQRYIGFSILLRQRIYATVVVFQLPIAVCRYRSELEMKRVVSQFVFAHDRFKDSTVSSEIT